MAFRKALEAGPSAVHKLCRSDFSEGSPPQHSHLEQGSRGDSETRARGGPSVSDADREPAAQVRLRSPARGLIEGQEERPGLLIAAGEIRSVRKALRANPG